ncbi:hypothetical protein BHM03_00022981 [Ensete ventricosum]|nr:hypothetical protein BHM03_00022981 [Ensete ventricosum]
MLGSPHARLNKYAPSSVDKTPDPYRGTWSLSPLMERTKQGSITLSFSSPHLQSVLCIPDSSTAYYQTGNPYLLEKNHYEMSSSADKLHKTTLPRNGESVAALAAQKECSGASRAEASRRQATHRVARRQAAHRVARLGPGRSTLFRYTLSGDKLFYIVRQYLMLRAVDKLF